MSEGLVFHKSIGSGPPLVILHGLFGSSDNWQTLASQWAENYTVIICDARNHGRSFHSKDFSYQLMSEDLERLLNHLGLDEVFLLGHSMGGKTVMQFSLKNSSRIKAMIVADIGPKSYPPHHDEIIAAFESVDLANTKSRGDAQKQVKAVVNNDGVALFLLKNLYWVEKGQLGWRINLPVLKREITKVTDALPSDEISIPTLFVRGGNSNYILNDDWPEIKNQFPNGHLVTLKDAGHWLHAEKPEAFSETVLGYLKRFE